MIRLRTLGGLGLIPEPASGTPQPRRLAILARLAVAGDVGVSRDVVVGQLWSETDEARAKHALTQALYGLRRDLGGGIVVQGTGSLRLNGAMISSDVADFRAALKAGDRRTAVELYAGEFLAGFYVREAEEFERWVEDTRRDLAREYREALESLAGEGDSVAQLPWLERLAALDPLDSRNALRLARAYAASGSPAVALRSLQAHQSLVTHELGAPVGRDVADVIKQLEAQAETQRAQPRTTPPNRAVSIGGELPEKETPTPPVLKRRQGWRIAAGLVVLVAAGVFGAKALAGGDGSLDPQKYVVVPFRSTAANREELLSGANCAQLVSSMLEGWRDIRRVDPLRVASTLAQRGQPENLDGLLKLAKALGAGRIIWGDVNLVGDSVRVRGAVFDVRRRNADPLRETSFSIPLELLSHQAELTRALGTKFSSLTRDLIVPGSSTVPTAEVGTVYASALEQKLRGDSALAQWNLPLARDAYKAALLIDQAWPQANLGLAQVEQWLQTEPDDSDAWRPYIVTAMVDTMRLSPAQRERALALRALADYNHPLACERYRSMIARDSTDFVAWYGLAECLAGDRVVIADPKSPSGYRFRSSYSRAIDAYVKALTMVPLTSSAFGGAALTRLVNKVYAEPNIMRLGRIDGDPSKVMLSFASLSGDTLGFIPWPPQPVLNADIDFPGKDRAVADARRTLLRITTAWTTALPNSAAALEAQATAMELAYPITGRMADSVLMLLRKARSASPESIRLRFQMVRVLLKAGNYTGVVALSDSTLRMTAGMSRSDLEQAAILAALRGKRDLAADLYERTAEATRFTLLGEEIAVDPLVSRLAQRLLVYASFIGPRDSLLSLWQAIMIATQAIPDSVVRRLTREASVERSQTLAFPYLGPPRDMGHVFAVEGALARHDTMAAHQELATLTAKRRPDAFVPADATLLEGRLWLLSGDTVRATTTLDRFLTTLPSSGTNLLPRVEHAASIGLILSLHAALPRLGQRANAPAVAPTVGMLWR